MGVNTLPDSDLDFSSLADVKRVYIRHITSKAKGKVKSIKINIC